jgi:hypothetical protein
MAVIGQNEDLGNAGSSALFGTDPLPIRPVLPRLEIASCNSVRVVQPILFSEKWGRPQALGHLPQQQSKLPFVSQAQSGA